MRISEAVQQIVAVYPGRFHPFHKGHASVYDFLKNKYDNVFIATSDKVDPPKSPFSFAEKRKMMIHAGVPAAAIVQTKNPYKAEEILTKFDPNTTVVVFAVSAKDMAEDPRFSFKPKKDGSPSYFQPLEGQKSLAPYSEHGYITTVPTLDFSVLGKPMRSATELRQQFAAADTKVQAAIIRDLYGTYSPEIHKIMAEKIRESFERVTQIIEQLIELDRIRPLDESVKRRVGDIMEAWSEKYKRSIDCDNPRGFSQRAHCQGRKKNEGKSPLNERATDIVYHYTTIGPALNILKSGEFQLSSVAGSVEQDINPKGHNFFLSTTRSKGGEYHSRVGDSAVMFVLNGRWISDRYPVKPVDYWAGFSIAGRNKEAEDRIFSKDPTMPMDPVTSIHVLLKEKHPFASAKTRQFLILAKTLGIPTYLYKDESAWRLQNTAKAASVEQMKSELSGPETFRTGGSGSRWLLPWLEVIFGKTEADLGKKAKDLVRGFRYYHNDGDDHGLGNELSNARKPGNLDREDAVKILKFMRQNRMLTHKDLVNYLVDKWKVKDESINEMGVGRVVKGVNTTPDVGPDEIKKQAAKMGFKVDRDGRPPLLHDKARKNSDPNTLFNLGLAESQEELEERGSISVPFASGTVASVYPHRPLKVKKGTPGKMRYEDVVKVREAEDHSDGTYAAVYMKPQTAQRLVDWCRDNGIKTQPAEEMHCTLVYSKTPVPELAQFDGTPVSITASVRGWKLLGTALVLELDCAACESLNGKMMAAGATSDYPSYIAHTTIDPEYAGDIPDVTPDFDLEYNRIVVTPINPDRSNPVAESQIMEKNVPTDPSKWSYYKGQAKKKFEVYPSAYANAWAAKKYKEAGGGWRKTKEDLEELKCWTGYERVPGKRAGEPGSCRKRGTKSESMGEAVKDAGIPEAITDIDVNLKNRNKAFKEYQYGPSNPAPDLKDGQQDLGTFNVAEELNAGMFKSQDEIMQGPNAKFWQGLMDTYNTEDLGGVLMQRCGNCAAFNVTKRITDAIADAIDPEYGDESATAGELGYCQFLKFKCAAMRTCEAWVGGGPITDETVEKTNEDLRDWFKQKWVNIGKKDASGKHPECGTSGSKKGYAKCVPASKAASMSKKEKESAVRRKRAAQNKAGRGGKDKPGSGKKPIRVSTKAKK